MRGHLIGGLLLAVIGLGLAQPSFAQQGPGGLINPERDCQTIRTCNFQRNGSYRGCLSSYSCRICRPVAARCSIGGAGNARVCRELRCNWGA
jgi:hypothetical protein